MDSVKENKELLINWLALDIIKKDYAEGKSIEVSETTTMKLLTNLMYCIKVIEQVRPPKKYSLTHVESLNEVEE